MKLVIIVSITFILFVSCSSKPEYNEQKNYQAYISDCNNGYSDIKYYCIEDSLTYSKKAKEYYKYNHREANGFIITDYKEGVCINRCLYDISYSTISIPKKIDNKPVVKIGAYLDGYEVIGAFANNNSVEINLPSTVKYISSITIEAVRGVVEEKERYKCTDITSFTVDKNNPYYCSHNGGLYSKDNKKLLYLNTNESNKFVVPNYVIDFEPSNGIDDLMESVCIEKNVKRINTYIDMGESGITPNKYCKPSVIIKGYKNTVAEKWAKKHGCKFIALN